MSADWRQRTSKIAELLSNLHKNAVVHEQSFSSDKPLLGRFIVWVREKWNSVSTKWYVRPMLFQQNRFNQTVAQLTQELVEAVNSINQRLDQLEERLISTDRDMTLVARKVAEGECRLRQSQQQILADTTDLAQRLAHLHKLLLEQTEKDETNPSL